MSQSYVEKPNAADQERIVHRTAQAEQSGWMQMVAIDSVTSDQDLAYGQPVIVAVRWLMIISGLVLAIWNVNRFARTATVTHCHLLAGDDKFLPAGAAADEETGHQAGRLRLKRRGSDSDFFSGCQPGWLQFQHLRLLSAGHRRFLGRLPALADRRYMFSS